MREFIKKMKEIKKSFKIIPLLMLSFVTAFGGFFISAVPQASAAQVAPVSGEIERIFITDRNDHWSGGEIVVGGQIVIVPRNLLIDLPANRLTLKQLFDEAPAACLATGETGLAKADICNTSRTGGFASISANVTGNGNIIAGDILIDKGLESITGKITYISYADGYFRIDGALNDPNTGTMVRLNDPDSRHTVQQGPGCLPGSLNCSPDPRFTLDPDNYTNIFSTGYPICIPSTVARNFTDTLGLGTTVAQATATGAGDVLCPLTNRTINGGLPVDDSRRLAPIVVGDNITADGNFETINGVRFLSAHSTMVGSALTTKDLATQPDYLFLDEVEVDAPAFQNQRARTLIIGYATKTPTDILIWSLQYDPVNNEAHEFPLATVQGCDTAAGAGTCGAQGLVGQGANIFKIRHDVDFLFGADPKLNPCAHLQADPRMGSGFCPNGGGTNAATPAVLAEQMAILSPIPHEIQARTGHAFANPNLITLDINGSVATNGQYLFPFGMNLGGISTPEMNEIDLNALFTPISFSGIPWLLDRRLSPGGCIDTDGNNIVDCEEAPQPLTPFPYEGIDPRTQSSLPSAVYNDPNFTASALTNSQNRMFSFVNSSGVFNGNNTLLSWPPVDPPAITIRPTPPLAALSAVNIAPSAAFLNAGDSQNFTAVPVDQFNSPTSATVTWTSSNEAVGTIDNAGTFTAIGTGTTTITATAVSGGATTTDAALVSVTAPVLLPVISAGWNLVGWSDLTTTSAEALGDSFVGADVVSKFINSTQEWISHIVNFPLNNFDINPGEGFFIHKQ